MVLTVIKLKSNGKTIIYSPDTEKTLKLCESMINYAGEHLLGGVSTS